MIDIGTFYYVICCFGVWVHAIVFEVPFYVWLSCVLLACCVSAVLYVWFRVSSSIFVEVFFYVNSIFMFRRGCLIFVCVDVCFIPLYVSFYLGWSSGIYIVRFVKGYICCAAIL